MIGIQKNLRLVSEDFIKTTRNTGIQTCKAVHVVFPNFLAVLIM